MLKRGDSKKAGVKIFRKDELSKAGAAGKPNMKWRGSHEIGQENRMIAAKNAAGATRKLTKMRVPKVSDIVTEKHRGTGGDAR